MADPTTQSVNPAMVTLAREARGLTQTELAALIGVSQAMMSKIEAGAKTPTAAMLGRLAMVLQYPESFFLQNDQVFGPGLSEFFHRRKQDELVTTYGLGAKAPETRATLRVVKTDRPRVS